MSLYLSASSAAATFQASFTRDAASFSASYLQLPPDLIPTPSSTDARAHAVLLSSASARAGTSAAAAIARLAHAVCEPCVGGGGGDRGAADTPPPTDALSAARDIAQTRIAHGADGAAERAVARCQLRRWRRIALVGGSAVAERAVAAMGDTVAMAVVLGDAGAAARLATVRKVELAAWEAAGAALRGSAGRCDALLIGAEAVHGDGRLVVAEGVDAVVRVARAAGVEVCAVVQTVKFVGDIVLRDMDTEGVEVMDGELVDVVCTEEGEFRPVDAPLVFRKYGVA